MRFISNQVDTTGRIVVGYLGNIYTVINFNVSNVIKTYLINISLLHEYIKILKKTYEIHKHPCLYKQKFTQYCETWSYQDLLILYNSYI